MFASRLAAAAAEVKADAKPLSPKCSIRGGSRVEAKDGAEGSRSMQDDDSARSKHSGSPEVAGGGGAAARKYEGAGVGAGAAVLNDVSEYLFDLYDANCMEEFHVIEQFESRAVDAFDPDQQEFTLEQFRLHQELCTIFEGFVGKFIANYGHTMESFYQLVRANHAALAVEAEEQQHKDAREITDVLLDVSDFACWAARMQERADRARSPPAARKSVRR